MKAGNGDSNRVFKVKVTAASGETYETVRGVGSFHKTLPHNEFGEVDPAAFAALVSATRGDGSQFSQVPGGGTSTDHTPGVQNSAGLCGSVYQPPSGAFQRQTDSSP